MKIFVLILVNVYMVHGYGECFPEMINKTYVHVPPQNGPPVVNTPSNEECFQHCVENVKCLAYTFKYDSLECSLFHFMPDIELPEKEIACQGHCLTRYLSLPRWCKDISNDTPFYRSHLTRIDDCISFGVLCKNQLKMQRLSTITTGMTIEEIDAAVKKRPECATYLPLDEADRRIGTYKMFSSLSEGYCDTTDTDKLYPKDRGSTSKGWRGAGWYRFQHPAGSKLAQSPPGKYHCGTVNTGWSNSTLPDKPGVSVDIKICFDDSENNGNWLDCWRSNEGKVTNCGSYFVYYLENAPFCRLRYCGSN